MSHKSMPLSDRGQWCAAKAMTAASRFERRLRVRFAHCDPSGIVFFPQYFVLFNGLIEDWVSDCLGVGYHDLIGRRRVGLPTVDLHTQFRAISRMGDDVTLWLAVTALGSRSLTLALGCTGDGEERVHVRQVLVTTDLDTHRAIAIPDDLRVAIDAFRQSNRVHRKE